MGVVPVPGPAPGAKPSADKTQPTSSKPVNGNGNASAAAAAAAASTAAAGASESIWSRWGAAAQKHIADLQVQADVASKEFQKQAKSFKMPKKWEMPGTQWCCQMLCHDRKLQQRDLASQCTSMSMSSGPKWCGIQHSSLSKLS